VGVVLGEVEAEAGGGRPPGDVADVGRGGPCAAGDVDSDVAGYPQAQAQGLEQVLLADVLGDVREVVPLVADPVAEQVEGRLFNHRFDAHLS
jgi:hypothetical protein